MLFVYYRVLYCTANRHSATFAHDYLRNICSFAGISLSSEILRRSIEKSRRLNERFQLRQRCA